MLTEDTALIEDVAFDELEADPYPFYARLRRDRPVAYLPLLQGWLITRWDDCEAIGKSADRIDTRNAYTENFFGPNILNMDGAAHAWLRGGVDPPLRPRAVQGYIEERTRPVAKAYVERLRPLGRADASTDLLELISVRVVGDVLGLSEVDDQTLQWWFTALNLGLNNLGGDPEIQAKSDAAMARLDEYMRGAVARLTAEPDDSGLSHMIHSAIGDGPVRTYDDLIGTIRVIILGGFQEPGHGAAASLLGLLSHPDQLAAVLEDPATHIPNAVHEGLRWISPFGLIQRRAITDIELHGVTIPEGAEINLACASANRDESRYDNGDEFDLFRGRQTHASFGYGAHFCSGHFISRQLERIALEEVLAGLPGIRLDPDNAPTVHGFGVRGVKHLPIVWDA